MKSCCGFPPGTSATSAGRISLSLCTDASVPSKIVSGSIAFRGHSAELVGSLLTLSLGARTAGARNLVRLLSLSSQASSQSIFTFRYNCIYLKILKEGAGEMALAVSLSLVPRSHISHLQLLATPAPEGSNTSDFCMHLHTHARACTQTNLINLIEN